MTILRRPTVNAKLTAVIDESDAESIRGAAHVAQEPHELRQSFNENASIAGKAPSAFGVAISYFKLEMQNGYHGELQSTNGWQCSLHA